MIKYYMDIFENETLKLHFICTKIILNPKNY